MPETRRVSGGRIVERVNYLLMREMAELVDAIIKSRKKPRMEYLSETNIRAGSNPASLTPKGHSPLQREAAG